jgi:hypothetical protein
LSNDEITQIYITELGKLESFESLVKTTRKFSPVTWSKKGFYFHKVRMEHLENAKNKEDVKSDLLKYFERIVEPNDKIILIAHNGNRLFFFVYFFYCFISIKV